MPPEQPILVRRPAPPSRPPSWPASLSPPLACDPLLPDAPVERGGGGEEALDAAARVIARAAGEVSARTTRVGPDAIIVHEHDLSRNHDYDRDHDCDPHHDQEDRDDDIVPAPSETSAILCAKDARDVIALLQCRICRRPFTEPITLPCGRSLCKSCLPPTHVRPNISYPATADRSQGFGCPFAGCAREHALADCAVDVTLNKVVERGREALRGARDAALAAGVPGGRLVDAWVAAEGSGAHAGVLGGGPDPRDVHQPDDVRDEVETDAAAEVPVLVNLRVACRAEVDCQVCYALLLKPLTTACGHTFCGLCLNRAMDHALVCPICRRALSINQRYLPPCNESLGRLVGALWPRAVEARRAAVAREHRHHEGHDIPLFICTLSFPMTPTFLHVFEPRYRLMIRRALEGDRMFGMVLTRPGHVDRDTLPFMELGTLLRIQNVEFFADGRSLIETVGMSRFRVVRHGVVDGYAVASVERVEDITVAEEEALEAEETRDRARPVGVGEVSAAWDRPTNTTTTTTTTTSVTAPTNMATVTTHAVAAATAAASAAAAAARATKEDLSKMQTSELMDFAAAFVGRMKSQSVSWLAQRILAIYGECPADPALFPWWFGSILPIRDEEKYRLLETSSVRERLKICCGWILEWEMNRWSFPECIIL